MKNIPLRITKINLILVVYLLKAKAMKNNNSNFQKTYNVISFNFILKTQMNSLSHTKT